MTLINVLRIAFKLLTFWLSCKKNNGVRMLLLGRTRDIIHCARASEPHGTFLPLILFRGDSEQELMATVTFSISPLSQSLNDTLEGSDVAPMRKDKTFDRTWCLASQVCLTPIISTWFICSEVQSLYPGARVWELIAKLTVINKIHRKYKNTRSFHIFTTE